MTSRFGINLFKRWEKRTKSTVSFRYFISICANGKKFRWVFLGLTLWLAVDSKYSQKEHCLYRGESKRKEITKKYEMSLGKNIEKEKFAMECVGLIRIPVAHQTMHGHIVIKDVIFRKWFQTKTFTQRTITFSRWCHDSFPTAIAPVLFCICCFYSDPIL